MFVTKQLIFASLVLSSQAHDLFLPKRELLAASDRACLANVLTLNTNIVKDAAGFYDLKTFPFTQGKTNVNLITKSSTIWTPSVPDCEPALCTIK